MLLFIQFSFTDVRYFCKEREKLVSLTNWHFPIPNISFARNMGECMNRRPLKIDNDKWKVDTHLFNAHNTFRFRYSYNESSYKIKNLKNHYFYDGISLCRFEFVFHIAFKNRSFGDKVVKSVIRSIENLDLLIKNPITKKFEKIKLSNIQNHLKYIHISASTKKSDINYVLQKELIKPNQTQIVTIINNGEFFHANKIESFRVSDNTFSFFINKYRVLLTKHIYYTQKTTDAQYLNEKLLIRQIRIINSMYFIEKECLINLLRSIETDVIKVNSKNCPYEDDNTENSKISDDLQRFLVSKINKLSDNKSKKINFDSVFKNQVLKIKDQIISFNFRNHVEKSIINYIETQYVNHIEEIMGDKITISGSVISGSVGTKSSSSGNNSNSTIINDNIDYDKLKDDLFLLRSRMQLNAKTLEEVKSLGEIANAEDAASKQDKKGVLEHLKKAGLWALTTAKEIGVEVVAGIIQKQTGIS